MHHDHQQHPRKTLKNGRSGTVSHPAKGGPKVTPKALDVEQFAWLPRELLESDAFWAMSTNTMRLLLRLLLEHLQHAGCENGRLIATYRQLEAIGCSKSAISEAIEEVEFLGLIRVHHGGRCGGSDRPNLYRLTWMGGYDANDTVLPPTNEWKNVDDKKIAAWKTNRRKTRAAKRDRRESRRLAQANGAKKQSTPMNSDEADTRIQPSPEQQFRGVNERNSDAAAPSPANSTACKLTLAHELRRSFYISP